MRFVQEFVAQQMVTKLRNEIRIAHWRVATREWSLRRTNLQFGEFVGLSNILAVTGIDVDFHGIERARMRWRVALN